MRHRPSSVSSSGAPPSTMRAVPVIDRYCALLAGLAWGQDGDGDPRVPAHVAHLLVLVEVRG